MPATRAATRAAQCVRGLAEGFAFLCTASHTAGLSARFSYTRDPLPTRPTPPASPATRPPPHTQLASPAAPGSASDSKIYHYGCYKAAFFAAYAHCFNGITLWKQQDQCGAGLKCLEAAAAQLAAAKRAAAVFDASPPVSLNLAHRCAGGEAGGGVCAWMEGWMGQQSFCGLPAAWTPFGT